LKLGTTVAISSRIDFTMDRVPKESVAEMIGQKEKNIKFKRKMSSFSELDICWNQQHPSLVYTEASLT